MTAIMRRELLSYFTSPVGYVYLSVSYMFYGFYFFVACLLSNYSGLEAVFSNMFSIVLFLIPVLTMRLLSEDKKNKTDQALLTAPVSLTGLVLGKFLAAALVYLLSLSVTLIYAFIIAGFTPPNWAMILGNYFGFLLLGSSFISIGMFISSLTENQVIAAVGGFAAAITLILLDGIGSIFQNQTVTQFITNISFMQRLGSIISGRFELAAVVFFLSVCALFIFLTVRVLEKRRWS